MLVFCAKAQNGRVNEKTMAAKNDARFMYNFFMMNNLKPV
jgi:hypothetical protein